MKILSWNINGYRAILKKGFKDFMDSYSPDIIGLQEVKSLPEQLTEPDTNIKGFGNVWNGAERKGYSGTAVFYKQKPISSSFGFGIQKFDCEGRVITTEYPDFYFINVYFPNGGQGEERLKYKMDFYDSFLEYAEKLKKNGKAIIFCGDVNTAHKPIDLARPKENEKHTGFLPMEREWINNVVSHGWVDTFRLFHPEPNSYTWWDYKTKARERNIGWRIDYFFIDAEHVKIIKDSFILPDILGSDHCPIGITL